MITEREAKLLDAEALRLLKIQQKQQLASLLNEVDELSKRGPLTAGVLGVASLACTGMDRYDDAVGAATKALAQEPDWAWLHHALALAESSQGNWDKAISAQTRAVQLLPTEAPYIAALAHYLRAAGQVDEAVKHARQGLVTAGEHPGLLNELGLALMEKGDLEGALEQFRQAQKLDRDDVLAVLNEGRVYHRQGDLAKARGAYRKALLLRQGYTPAEDLMADTLGNGPFRGIMGQALILSRITIIGWAMLAFLYYVLFRVLEMLWKAWPVTLPLGQWILIVSGVYLMGGLALGNLLRLAFRMGWPK